MASIVAESPATVTDLVHGSSAHARVVVIAGQSVAPASALRFAKARNRAPATRFFLTGGTLTHYGRLAFLAE